MSQTQTVTKRSTLAVREQNDLPSLAAFESRPAPPKRLHTSLDSIFFPVTARPRKFDSKGRRSTEWNGKIDRMTPLQKHCAYFLREPESTKIYPADTFFSVRAWGWNWFLCVLTTAIIHFGLSYFSQPPGMLLPNPYLPVYLSDVHRTKHGSDSGSYNSKGSFKREMFDDFFANYDKDGKGGLTLPELYDAWRGQRIVFDPFGWSASAFEWLAVYLLLWPDDGVVRKTDAEGVFNGEIFWRAKELEDDRRLKNGLRPRVY